MANSIDDLIAKIADYSYAADKLAEDNKVVTLVKNLEGLSKEINDFGFSAEIAQQILPRVNAQREALEQLYNQLQSVSASVSKELTAISDVFDNIPYGKLKKMGFDTRVKKANTTPTVGLDGNGVAAQAPVNAPQAGELNSGMAPQSAMLQNETTIWSNLKAQFGGSKLTEQNSGWNRIKESVDELGIDLGDLDPSKPEQMTIYEAALASLPKGAGDLNSRPDPRDAEYEMYAEAMADVLPGTPSTRLDESMGSNVGMQENFIPNEILSTTEPSRVEPIQNFNLASFADSNAANFDYDNFDDQPLAESCVSYGPDMDEGVGETLNESVQASPVQIHSNYDDIEADLASKIVG